MDFKPKQNKPVIALSFVDHPELFEMINKYRRLSGWTWKRLFLAGVAENIHKQGDNPDLILEIVKYMEAKR